MRVYLLNRLLLFRTPFSHLCGNAVYGGFADSLIQGLWTVGISDLQVGEAPKVHGFAMKYSTPMKVLGSCFMAVTLYRHLCMCVRG